MRLLSIPAMLIGIAVAIIFFKIYGFVSRPAVPLPVATVVSQFAPGVEIGAKVSDARHSVAAMTYVPHLGFVGLPGTHSPNLPNGGTVSFSQVRLLLDEQTRTLPNPNPAKARIDAVEVVTADASATSDIMTSFLYVFRRQPRDGCLRTSDEGRFREVHVWTTPNDRGGVALITDFVGSAGAARRQGPTMTNIIAFLGKFDGGRTLRGNYTDANCTQIAQGA